MNNLAFFSNIRSEILSHLSNAKKEVLIAMAWFTNRELLDALIQCLKRGVKVKLILLDDIINHCDFGADFNLFIKEEGSEFYLYPPSTKFMHHKFCVIDCKTLITGSYNWTNYAENRNLENIVVTNDTSLIESYTSCFDNMIKDLILAKSFDMLTLAQVPEREFSNRIIDIANEVFSTPQSESKTLRNHFKEKAVSTKVEIPESINSELETLSDQQTEVEITRPKVVISDIDNFKYAVSKFNIGFKANLLDQGGKLGLKVMIEKGQALPCTITRDAESANAGDFNCMNSTCEFYFGETTNISECTKFGETLKLENLPKMKEGEVKFKIIITLDALGQLSIKFVCTNTGTGVEGKYTNKDFIDYRVS